jgi:hypothetical protein
MNVPYVLSIADLQDPSLYRLNNELKIICSQITPAISVALSLQFTGGIGFVATAYNGAITASGGVAPYTYSTMGTLPAGLSVNLLTGVILGTPSATGTFNFIGNVTDADGDIATLPITITISTMSAYVGPSTVTDVTTSRAIGTTYTNANSVAMIVNVIVDLAPAGTVSAFVGPSSPSVDIAGFANPSAAAPMIVTVSFPVPSGYKYEITSATSIVKWVESV